MTMTKRRPKSDDDDWSSERPWTDGVGSYGGFSEYVNLGAGDPLPERRPIGFLHFPTKPKPKRKGRKRA